jgi:midasin
MNQSSNAVYSLLEKHLYTINIISLSRGELAEIICKNYPKLATVSKRVVDVFLIFSNGGHRNVNESYDNEESCKKNVSIDSDEILPYVRNTPITNLLNSGRMVSTRDLLKLCKRSNSNFQVTSTECAYLVFQNCVDLFCSHLPAGKLKTDLIVNIGARLGIIETRCIHLANELKPTVKLTLDDLNIGRASLSRNDKEVQEKKMKTNEKVRQPTFSFTRVSSCILERIAVAVHQNEAVLLVGETGTGKTSSVQYLAHQTNHKLVVVNMNNQSDVSDLIGGYKPVDISFIISPLRNEFEKLFARTFDLLKNEKFLSHVAACFNRSDYVILVKLMLKVISNAYKILSAKEKSVDFVQWQVLEKKLQKLDHQLKTSINLSFAFIPGSLVNCIRNGDWVLLDEINLASAETLECLSTILEPDGSIILLERGDFVPVTRHPDFRIFSCMNPSTDVGKKDLPIGIRNRFTEFFVDELTYENDLLILVGDYLNNTGIEKSRIHKAVQLYMELRRLSQLELNDGLGNKPVFSLRTLCRALRICSKNLCGSTERNIYESFCLSFLTQLDAQSHDVVVQLIQKFLVSDVKMVLSQQIPRPAGNQINFEGYWIEKGEKEPLECKEYILTESVKKNLKDLARIISIGKLPILLQGPTSAGKTSLIEYIAKRSGNHCLRINNHEHTDLQEYIGTYVADVTGKLAFQEGILVKAMRNGYWIILDELNLAPSDILEALNRVLDDNRELYIPETQVVVKAHPNFMLFATQNPPGLYGGRKTLSRAFKNRFIELHFSEIPKKELEIILEKRCLIPMKYAQKMVKTMSSLQVNRRTTSRNNFTLRDLFRWGNRYTFADKKLLNDRNYDWNQHLVDEGYLVLSAKIRNQIENEIIIETLLKNFSKRILVENLFTLNNNTSMVTKEILQSLEKYNGTQQIVWTYEMRRMAILVSKSLQFDEPVLLVGLTGCGKTTVCQILAEIMGRKLRILNCHMHTEGADFLGGLRPCRESKNEKSQLFEWSDGPLVLSMTEGNFFLADEISLAEDSVLERLNSILEPDRTLLLAEKGGVDESIIEPTKNSEFIVQAAAGFQFLATMNPGGDFGKKELSPALRNRFTEIWCAAICDEQDMIKIAENAFKNSYKTENQCKILKISEAIIKTVVVLKTNVEKLNFSIRDVLAWVKYIAQNYSLDGNDCTLSISEALVFGLHTIFLDALEMLPYENLQDTEKIRKKAVNALEMYAKQLLDTEINFSSVRNFQETEIELNERLFGINPFYLDVNSQNVFEKNCFSFSAPTTKHNLFRVLSALTLKKAILLEGAPGKLFYLSF